MIPRSNRWCPAWRPPPYPGWQAGQAVSTVVSPDGNTLLILTSGYNRIYNAEHANAGILNSRQHLLRLPELQEYVFIFDISKGAPVQKQVLTIPNSYNGIAFDPSGKAFYVSGGMGDYPLSTAPGDPPPANRLHRHRRQCARLCSEFRRDDLGGAAGAGHWVTAGVGWG